MAGSRRTPQPPARPTRPSPPPVDITEGAAAALPPPDQLLSGGETGEGIPFLIRAADGTTVELATAANPGSKPRTAAKINPEAGLFKEAGSASPSPFTSGLRNDPNRDLFGQRGIAKYREMWRTSGSVRASLRRLQTPIESARWTVIPGEDTSVAKKQAEFVSENLFDGLDVTWAQTLADILLMVRYGYSILHKVYVRDTGTGGGQAIRLAKLAPRHVLEVEHVEYDDTGSPDKLFFYSSGAYQQRADGSTAPLGGAAGGGQTVPIEMSRLVIFTLDGEAGDIQGTSALRSAYGHWLIMQALMRIDAIQKERHSLGVPVITLPPGATAADIALAEEIGRNLRANERAHVVLPDPNWKLEWAKLDGQPVDPRDSLDWHDQQIYKNTLWDESDNGYDLFMKSTRYLADRIADTLNRWVVRELVQYNWANVKKYPRITPRWIGEFEDMRTRSFAIRNLVGADLITPDEVLEAQLRKELDLPVADIATRRVVEAPQNPNDPSAEGDGQTNPNDKAPPGTNVRGQATTKQDGADNPGKPRQGKPPTGRQAANAGTDRSGNSGSR